ncbi:MAG: hypothetical protein AAAB35_13000 [Phyllobacterium sp.]|uniref:hypothetical protein n=1 Tax=Phyllobacterium sp. TaxID=1871046 RepID=UPI0030F21D24
MGVGGRPTLLPPLIGRKRNSKQRGSLHLCEADAPPPCSQTLIEADRRNRAALDDMRTSHTMDYRVTLTAVGTKEAEAVFLNHLSDADFGTEAAMGLQVMWQESNEPRREGRVFQPWPDFERAAARRFGDRNASTNAAEAILAAATAAKSEGTREGLRRGIKLAGCAVLLPHGEKSAIFADLIISDVETSLKLVLAQRMVVGGEVVPSTIIAASLRVLVAERWLGDHEVAQAFDWLELLPFSDNPMTLLDRSTSLPRG